jgi:hypothetical protein
MKVTLGAGRIDRVLPDADELLNRYLTDIGLRYLDYRPIIPADRLVPEDSAVTILINSRVGWRAFESVQDHGDSINFGAPTIGHWSTLLPTSDKGLQA